MNLFLCQRTRRISTDGPKARGCEAFCSLFLLKRFSVQTGSAHVSCQILIFDFYLRLDFALEVLLIMMICTRENTYSTRNQRESFVVFYKLPQDTVRMNSNGRISNSLTILFSKSEKQGLMYLLYTYINLHYLRYLY